MKENLALKVTDLMKEYRITADGKKQSFRALDGLSLEVEKGQVLGIVGSNGAGKSTLLKILSRITHPTSGEALIRGKLSSLLEVGTGFHPELSGRDNIFLNGSILGMKRREIKERFDDILDFSGIGRFIDTPVKHYSSGMYVRLAFSVAANLSPDILLVDEVLAVGDAAFQRKCLQRMDQARTDEGRTVLMVSHNMSTIRQLSDRVIWLREGKLHREGDPEEVISAYLREMREISQEVPVADRKDRAGTGEVRVKKIAWNSPSGVLLTGKPASLNIAYQSDKLQSIPGLNFRMHIYKDNGEYLGTLSNEQAGQGLMDAPANGNAVCAFDALPLLPGTYYLTSNLFVNSIKSDKVEQALTFSVLPGDFHNAGAYKSRERQGVALPQQWKLED